MRNAVSTMFVAIGLMGFGLGCGGAADKTADSPAAGGDETATSDGGDGESSDGESSETNGESPSKASAGKGVPTECGSHAGDTCLPPKKFMLALCNHTYPSVALTMFASGTPWTRGYLTHETEAVNASGGGSSNDKMKLDEEVLVMRKRVPNLGGMTVSGAEGSYDVLRWDGTCVTLHPSEIRFQPPRKIRNARIIWGLLEMHIRNGLKEIDPVYKGYIQWKKTCKGVSFGKVSKECVKADKALSEIIATQVREEGGAPAPKKLPEL